MLAPIILGLLLGIISGVIPGLHVNLISLLIIQNILFLQNYFSTLEIAITILTLTFTSLFFGTLAEIFTGIPDESQVSNALPGHQLVLKGLGYEAVFYTTVGKFFAIISLLLLSPLLFIFLPQTYTMVKPYTGYFLIAISLMAIYSHKGIRLKSLALFLFSGTLGILMLNSSFIKEPIFLLFVGSFGITSMLDSLFEKSKIPPQKITSPSIPFKEVIKTAFSITPLGIFFSLFPAIGPSHISIMSGKIVKKQTDNLLLLSSIISSLNVIASIFTLYLINKARNDPIVNVGAILKTITFQNLLLFITVILVVSTISVLLVLWISKKFLHLMTKINYFLLNSVLLLFLVILTFILTGFQGLLIIIVCTALGLYATHNEISRQHIMGALIIPVMCYYLI